MAGGSPRLCLILGKGLGQLYGKRKLKSGSSRGRSGKGRRGPGGAARTTRGKRATRRRARPPRESPFRPGRAGSPGSPPDLGSLCEVRAIRRGTKRAGRVRSPELASRVLYGAARQKSDPQVTLRKSAVCSEKLCAWSSSPQSPLGEGPSELERLPSPPRLTCATYAKFPALTQDRAKPSLQTV